MVHAPGFLKLVESRRPQVREVTPADLEPGGQIARQGAFHLIDVREDHEWQAGHLPGARHLGRGVMERDIEAQIPDPDAEIVLYCGGGYRSVLAAVSLQEMGYRRVSSLAGGYRGWVESGRPIVTP
jgi:rhodanese-related sulfurtransferase